jgi:hypothetical protein
LTGNETIILLESEHYDVQKVIEKILNDQDFESLKESRDALSVLVQKAKTEILNLKKNQTPDESPSLAPYQEKINQYKFLPFNFVPLSELELRKREINAKKTYEYIIDRKSTRNLPGYARWKVSDAHDFLVHPEKGVNRLEKPEQFQGISWSTFSKVYLPDKLPLLTRIGFLASCLALFALFLPGSVPIATLLYLMLLIPRTRLWFIDKTTISDSETDKWKESVYLLEKKFQEFEIGQKIEVNDYDHMNHLSLGQFFQPKNHLFRFMGFATGVDHVFLLRKSMRGTSDDVDDYITRFTPPQLVTLHIDEFVNLYCGESLDKSDQWWDRRIITPGATHG